MSQKRQCYCLECGKIFYEYASRIKDGRGKYCSKKCTYKSRETYIISYCKECGKEFRAFKSQVNKGRGFCCVKCHGLYKKQHSNTTVYGRFFNIYSGIKNRCDTSHKDKDIINYQKKGIKCLWKNFEQFKDDMYKSYLQHVNKYGEKNTSIDRIDNYGNYCRENCRWVTPKIQINNRDKSLNVIFNGIEMNYYEFAKIIHRSTTNTYLHLKNGKTVEEIYELSKKYDNKGKLI